MIEQKLTDALIDLKGGIEAADAETIRDRMAFLDEALHTHRKELDSQLKHYLKNRSYMKALAFLQGKSAIPKGRCGGRNDFS